MAGSLDLSGGVETSNITASGTLVLSGDATFNNRTVNISNSNGIHVFKNTNDVAEVFRVGNDGERGLLIVKEQVMTPTQHYVYSGAQEAM